MKAILSACTAGLVVLLSGCAGVTYKPIALDNAFYQNREGVIGVAEDKTPEATAHMLGPQGLLDVAINRGNAAKLMEHLKTVKIERVGTISGNLAEALTRRGFKVSKLGTIDTSALPELKRDESPELYAQRDFQSLKSRGIDRLLLVSVERVGTLRSYQGFIPVGPPRAVLAVRGQLIDLATNKLLWYNYHEATTSVAEPWDQEPDFPNISAAVLKNAGEGAEAFERSLFAPPAPAAK